MLQDLIQVIALLIVLPQLPLGFFILHFQSPEKVVSLTRKKI